MRHACAREARWIIEMSAFARNEMLPVTRTSDANGKRGKSDEGELKCVVMEVAPAH
jgi:hypothetical protein